MKKVTKVFLIIAICILVMELIIIVKTNLKVNSVIKEADLTNVNKKELVADLKSYYYGNGTRHLKYADTKPVYSSDDTKTMTIPATSGTYLSGEGYLFFIDNKDAFVIINGKEFDIEIDTLMRVLEGIMIPIFIAVEVVILIIICIGKVRSKKHKVA